MTIPNIIDALIDGAKNALSVALACACAGIIVGIVTLTGLGIVFTQAVLALAQNSLFLALALTGVAGIVLGMGMPTTPAYIVMTSLLVPALIKLGAAVPAAHMFAFYFAILSAITPPVALAVFAAASLAKSDLWASGWAAVRIGAAGFIVPFMFVYQPAILMIGTWPRDHRSDGHAPRAGCLILAAGLHGYFLRRCQMWERVVLVVAAIGLIDPNWYTDLAGAAGRGHDRASAALSAAARQRRLIGASGRAHPDRVVVEAAAAVGIAGLGADQRVDADAFLEGGVGPDALDDDDAALHAGEGPRSARRRCRACCRAARARRPPRPAPRSRRDA